MAEEYARALSVEEVAADPAAVAGEYAHVVAEEVVLPPTLDEPPAKPKAKAAKKPPHSGPRVRRCCKFPGCDRSVKAQGHCQRHGARTKRCKVATCKAQAQGGHEGYCKSHWREFAAPPDQRKKPTRAEAKAMGRKCDPVGVSVYDAIIPSSFAWRAEGGGHQWSTTPKSKGKGKATPKKLEGATEMIPILHHLAANEHQDPGWHRAEERLSRGIRPPKSNSVQLESWERQLAVLEMALVSGVDTGSLSAHKVSKLLGHAWGREKGFHKMMVEKHCGRRGELDRKSRSDAGKPMTEEKRLSFQTKLRATKATRKRKAEELQQQLGEVLVPMAAATATANPMMAAVPTLAEGGQPLAGYAEMPSEPPLEEPAMDIVHEV